MRAISPEQREALEQRIVMRRDFVFFDALELDGATPKPRGFWTGRGTVELDERVYVGQTIVGISPSVATGDLAIPARTVTLSRVAPEVQDLVRGSVLAQRRVEILIGFYNVETRALIGGLVPDFIGKVDDIELPTPAKGEAADISIVCESASRELTIARTDTRSDACLKLLYLSDRGYEYTGMQREKPLYFGRKGGGNKGGKNK